jgi:hypothetical protein
MRYFAALLGLALMLAATRSVAEGVPAFYQECADKKGSEADICNNEQFSKRRLLSGSEEDLWAQQTQNNGGTPDIWYYAPVADIQRGGDGSKGISLLTCDTQRNNCLADCKNQGACSEACQASYTQCAGGSDEVSGLYPRNNKIQTDTPDTYVIEYDDKVGSKGN